MKHIVTGIVLSTILASVSGLLVTLSMSGTALADPGGLGIYFSNDARAGQSGQDFGQQVQTYARPGDQPGGHEQWGVKNLGDNFAYYASGTCHTSPCE